MYPERGVHTIRLHAGVEEGCPKALYDTAFALHHPLRFQSGGVHKGELPAEASLLDITAEGTVLSGIFSENDALHIRLVETCGKADTVTLSLRDVVSNAELVDLSGQKTGDVQVSGHTIKVNMEPNTVATVRIF